MKSLSCTNTTLSCQVNINNVELAQMHLNYALADGTAAEARRMYLERYLNRQIPSERMFRRLHARL